MRSYTFFAIVLLCLAILLIDTLAFFWLKSIMEPITSSVIRSSIFIAFWFFTIGLIISILVLKIRLESIAPKRKQLLISSLYGLTVSSFIPKLIFVVVISILYFSNFLISGEKSLLIIPVVGVFFGFLPFFVIVYAVFRAVYRFKVHHVKIKSELLPKNFSGLRIVQISDLHLGSFNYRYHILDRAIKTINQLNPDFIFFTGDLVNNYAWELNGWENVLKQLSAKQGKYSVLGNHDYGDYSKWESEEERKSNFDDIKDFQAKIGFKLLLNEAESIVNNGEEIAIVGVENWGNPPFKQYGDLKKSLLNVNGIAFKILLSHDPSHWRGEVVEQTNIALTLSGHTHGMQAGINIRNKKWSPIKYKYEHWAGLYRLGQQYLYVSRGLGWMGFPGRLGMRPEITFIELEKVQ
ncbi:metallophosphoesterase [Arenibacter sp. BSSL-BM3]|uniref:Metallophosphoesterase n=1 Tax=Arenibacter arenosicollis TaxID=2762274 RepID=A0ABR7QHV7_9FLAO|nr:metallophosphoesterase [Arenibacter arenosicollis]MBC8766745.1 metallophosphoesterase [Arenibacter arenosicollis]